MNSGKSILVQGNLIEYFKELVTSAIRNQQLATDEMAEYYLVQLLSEFHKNQKIVERCPKTGEDEPFAITYLRALNSEPTEKFTLLKGLGDRSLYLSGIFTEHLEATPVGIDYYISLGGNAYTQVADSIGSKSSELQDLFQELSTKFPAFMEILSEVSETAGMRKDSDLLKIYDRWLRTGSDRAAKTLTKAGIPLYMPDGDLPQ